MRGQLKLSSLTFFGAIPDAGRAHKLPSGKTWEGDVCMKNGKTKCDFRRLAYWIRFDLRFALLLTTVVALRLVWQRERVKLEERIVALERKFSLNRGVSWSTDQAIGPPDCIGPGDATEAWASQTADGQMEWLELSYLQSVCPTSIEVYENFCPGAVVKATAFDYRGLEHVIWEGTDPLSVTGQTGIAKLPITSSPRTDRIRIYLDSPKVRGWNEIDAVGMRYGWWGNLQWANRATASSTWSARGYNCNLNYPGQYNYSPPAVDPLPSSTLAPPQPPSPSIFLKGGPEDKE